MLNALTIDLEDWYQGLTSTSRQRERWSNFESRVVANTEKVLYLLAQAEVKATFFVLGYVADQFPELIRRVADSGHEIALHSYDHQQVQRLTPDQFRQDVARSREVVEKACGKPIKGYRAPMFSINGSCLWALEILCEMGFEYDSSAFPVRNMYYGYPSAPRYPYRPFDSSSFMEFPLATVQFLGINWPVGGGFYFRTFPYPLLQAGIRRLNHQKIPAVLYFHPWELDLEQRYWQVTPRERITHYHGRASLAGKLQRLLKDFEFTTLSGLANNIA